MGTEFGAAKEGDALPASMTIVDPGYKCRPGTYPAGTSWLSSNQVLKTRNVHSTSPKRLSTSLANCFFEKYALARGKGYSVKNTDLSLHNLPNLATSRICSSKSIHNFYSSLHLRVLWNFSRRRKFRSGQSLTECAIASSGPVVGGQLESQFIDVSYD